MFLKYFYSIFHIFFYVIVLKTAFYPKSIKSENHKIVTYTHLKGNSLRFQFLSGPWNVAAGIYFVSISSFFALTEFLEKKRGKNTLPAGYFNTLCIPFDKLIRSINFTLLVIKNYNIPVTRVINLICQFIKLRVNWLVSINQLRCRLPT